ncbi:MAG: cell division protein ZapA [Deltaproteobacteria bacterium]|nr:cell division protein ZapA [Deltaproteobacteria bacterium]
MKKQYQIRVLGQDISVLSDSGDEHVGAVVSYVNDKVREIQKNAKAINILQVAILAALNIADEHFTLKGLKEDICHQMESKSEQLIHLINEIRQ